MVVFRFNITLLMVVIHIQALEMVVFRFNLTLLMVVFHM